MFEAGVVLAGGSDAGVGLRPFGAYPADVSAVADATPYPVGLSAVDALRSATSVAAMACGLSDTGRLAPGMRADLVAVAGNPLHDINDLKHVQLVVCNGRVAADPSFLTTRTDG